MKAIALMAGVCWMAAGCGGGDKPPAVDTTSAAAPATTEAPMVSANATHDVNMVLEGTAYRFVPSELTIKPGDKVIFHNVSGGPHNVQFWADSIPAASRAALDAAMTGEKLGELTGPLLVEPNQTYEMVFAGMVDGDYRFTCTPHMTFGMSGKITIRQ